MPKSTIGASGGPEPFELYALHYATHTGRREVDNLIGGDPHETGADLAYFIWVARRSDRTFVIDVGFGEEQARTRGRNLIRTPKEALGLIGIDGNLVNNVILTHLHYDHAGTISDFPKARFHVQDAEVAYATGRCMCHSFLRQPFSVEDVVSLVRCVHAERVEFHDGTVELADGLTVHRIGGHSGGLQVVRVWTRRGWVVIASDASHFYANLQRKLPFPAVFDVGAMMEGFSTLHRLAASPDHIVPGHDPQVMAIYPPVCPELAGIAFRLDEDPQGKERE